MADKIRIMSLIGALSILCSIAGAQETRSFTLDQASKYALENSVDAKISDQSVETARQQVREALSIGFPQVNAGLGYNYYLSLPTTLLPDFVSPVVYDINQSAFGLVPDAPFDPPPPVEVQFGLEHNVNARAEISQMVFDGSYIVGVRASKVFVELSQKRADLTDVEIKYNVERAYYTALVAEERIRFANQNIGIVQKTLNETRALYENGFVEELEVDRLELSLARLNTFLTQAETETDLAVKLLKFQMGMDINEKITLTDTLYQFIENQEIIIDEQTDYKRRPEYRVIENQKIINEMNVRYFRSAYLPTLFLFASYEQQAQRGSFNFFESGQPWFEIALVGVELNIPIFDGFFRDSRVQQAKIQLETIRLNEEKLEQSVGFETEQSKTNYRLSAKRLNDELDNLALAEKIYNTTLIKYREGVGSSIEVTNAESDLYQSQSNYVAAVYDMLIANTDLKKALGNY